MSQQDTSMINQQHALDYSCPPDEISLKKFILVILDFSILILKRWYIVLFSVSLLGGVNYYLTSKIKETYPAKVKIFVKSQYLAKKNKSSIKIFSQLLNARAFLEKTFLFHSAGTDSTNMLINKYLDTYFRLKPKELDKEIPFGFQFSHDKIDALNREETFVLNKVMEKVTTPLADFTDGFVSISADVDLGFITMNVSSPTEALSLEMLDKFYACATSTLLQSSEFANNKAYTNLKIDSDTLSKKYQESYYQLSIYRDKRGREILKESPSEGAIKYLEKKIHSYEVRADILKSEYLASIEQLKAAQLEMDKSSLLIRELERTYPPITVYKPDPKIAGIKWGIIGAVLAITFLMLIKIFKNIATELKTSKTAES